MPEAEQLETTIEVEAPPERVWELVSDLPRMAEWSPQVVKTIARGPIREGSTTININRQRWKVWPTRSRVVRFEPRKDIAFRILENNAVWSYGLEPTSTGTRVTHRRELPDGLSTVAEVMTKVALGGRQQFDGEVREGMQQTLSRIKAEAEG